MRRSTLLAAAASVAIATTAWAQAPQPAPQGNEATPDAEFTPWTNGQPPSTGAAPAAATAPKKDEKKATTTEAATQQPSSPDEWNSPVGAPTAAPETTPPPAPGSADAVPPPPTTPPAAPPPREPLPSSSASAANAGTATANVVHTPEPAQFNHVSIYGAPTLGQWKRGLGAYLGFPLLGIKAGIGLMDRLDAGLGFDSFYGVMNEPRLWSKYNVANGPNWSFSVQLEAGAAFFTQRPEAEGKGARWLTGRRNFNVEPGIIVSYRGDSVQSARLFLDARYAAAFDTQPYTKDPLGGVPPPVVMGSNVPIRMGAEMPFSPSTSFLFVFGFDIHGRSEDSVFMPVVSVGLVTGI